MRLYVREGIRAKEGQDGFGVIEYRADGYTGGTLGGIDGLRKWRPLWEYGGRRGSWIPAIHMPKWAVRIRREITGISIERVGDISEEDAIAEGVRAFEYGTEYDTDYGGREHNENYSKMYGMERLAPGVMAFTAKDAFRRFLWDKLNAKRGYPWQENPWVWRIEWKKETP